MKIINFRSRKIKIKIISEKNIRNVDIIVEDKRRLLYYSNSRTSDELWESYNDVLRILSKKRYRSVRKWWKRQFSTYV